jgi:hypothetical protein
MKEFEKLIMASLSSNGPRTDPKENAPRCIATVIYIEDVFAPRTGPKENAPAA